MQPTSPAAAVGGPVENADMCVVVPMYNEATVVGDVVARLRTVFDRVVCVDDGSTDSSAEVASAAGATVVRHCTNLGPGAALRTGLEYAVRCTDAEYIVTFDADGQHRVEDAEAMVSSARADGVDILLGSRFLTATSDIPSRRRLLLRGALQVSRMTSRLELTDTHNGLRVLRRRVASELNLKMRWMAYASELEAAIRQRRWTYREFPVSVLYTDYSVAKGQRGINAVNIVLDLLIARVRLAR
jgi:polyprenyl-phospho-N-acetylgalactosaminyl synthase